MRTKKKLIPAPNKQQINFYRKTYTDSLPSFDQPTTSQSVTSPKCFPITSLSSEPNMQILSTYEFKDLDFSASIDQLAMPRKSKEKTKHLEDPVSREQSEERLSFSQLKSAEYLGISNDQLFNELETTGNVFKLLDDFEFEGRGIEIYDLDKDVIDLSEEEFESILESVGNVEDLYDSIMGNDTNDNSKIIDRSPPPPPQTVVETVVQDYNTNRNTEEKEIEEQAGPSNATPFANLQSNRVLDSEIVKLLIPLHQPETKLNDSEICTEKSLDMQKEVIKSKYLTQKQRSELLKRLEDDFNNLSEFRNLTTDKELGFILQEQCDRLKREIKNQHHQIREMERKHRNQKKYRENRKREYENALKDRSNPNNMLIIKKYEQAMEKIRLRGLIANMTPEQVEKKRARNRVANMTEEQIERERKRLREKDKKRRNTKKVADMTEEQKEKRRKRDRDYKANMTEEQKERVRENYKKRKANMTEEQKERERERSRLKWRKKKDKMTEEQIEKERKRLREKDRRRRANMTEEQKEEKRKKDRDYRLRKRAEKLAQQQQ